MDMHRGKIRNSLMIIGFTMMVLLGIVSIISVASFFAYNHDIKEGSVTEIFASVSDYRIQFSRGGRYNGINGLECASTIEYSVNGEDYTKEDNSCLPMGSHTKTLIYYKNTRPQTFFHEKEITYKAFLKLLWPALGFVIFFGAKKMSEY